MKGIWTYLSAIVIVPYMVACQGRNGQDPIVTYDEETGYTIITDTVTIDTRKFIAPYQKMFLTDVYRYQNRYICLFEYNPISNYLDFGKGTGLTIFSISRDGQEIVQMPTPTGYKNLNSYDFELEVINDKLYFHRDEWDSGCIWNEDEQEWQPTDCIPDQPSDEGNFIIEGLSGGEWENFVQFHEKSSGKDYLFKQYYYPQSYVLFEGSYYVIEDFLVWKVANPHEGWVDSIGYSWSAGTKIIPYPELAIKMGHIGLEKLGLDDLHAESYCTDSIDAVFRAGFIRKNELYFLVEDKAPKTYLEKCQIEEGKSSIKKVLSWKDVGLQKKPKNSTLIIFNQCKLTEGILDISDDTIRMTYLKKVCDTLKYQGEQVAVQIVDFMQNNLGSATIERVRDFEQSIDGCCENFIFKTDWKGETTEEKASDYERVNYVHVLDSRFTFNVGYCYNRMTRILTSVSSEFRSTNYYNGESIYLVPNQKDFEAVDSIITQGLAVKEDSVGLWRKNNHTFQLMEFGLKFFAH